VTLFELLGCLVATVCSLLAAWLLGHLWGPAGYALGPPLALAGLYGFAWAAARFEDARVGGRPRFPPCRAGVCGPDDYTAVVADRRLLWRCRCGETYARQGRHFRFVDEAGEDHPHLVWRSFRRWEPDGPTG